MTDQINQKPAETLKDTAQQAAKKETTSPPKREYRTFLFQVSLFAALGAFALLTFMVATIPSFPIDLEIERALQSINSPIFVALMNLVSWPGFSPQSFIISALIIVVIYVFGWRWEALTAFVAALVPPLLNVIIKEWIRRPRPSIDVVNVFQILESYSFPSGHVMFYVGFFGFLWFVVYTLLKRSGIRTLLLIILGSLIGLVGISRIYLGQHWPSDVLGAYLLGGLVLVAIIQFYTWGKKRFFVKGPAAADQANSTEQ